MATAHRQGEDRRKSQVPIRADRRPRLGKALAGGVTAAVVAALLAPGSAFADTQGTQPSPQRLGAAPTAPAGAVKAGGPADSAELNLSVTLNPRDPGALQSFIGAVSNPNSPEYRHYLKTGEFAQRFGADSATVASVTKALSDAGLHPGNVGQNGLTIPVKATVAEAKHAFDTDFTGYKLADGTVAYANTQAPKVAGTIASRITGVVGLDNLVKPHAKHVVKDHVDAAPVSATTTGVAPHFNNGQPTLCGQISQLETSKGRSNYQDYYSADALANVYRLPFGAGNGGAGSTVAFLEFEEYSDAAVQAYQNCYGTNTSVSRIKVDGGPTAQPALNNSVGIESALDIETVIGLVPNASLLVYQGPDAATAQNVLDVDQQMVNDNRAQVISISWGMCELASNAAALAAQENVIFQQAAAQGQTVVAASGDSGSTDCYHAGTTSTLDNQLSTDDPASQPYVTGVGGTSMTGGQSTPLAESVWNSSGSGGGGVSHIWSLDSATGFQTGVTGQGYSNACGVAASAGKTCRQVPDVSALADTAHGYLISTFADSTGSYWGRIGGTSGAAPLWAAVIANANANSQCAAGGPLGYLNPALYKLNPGALRDITVGNNDLAASGYTGGLYKATAGYDLASGLGTPNADLVTNALCTSAPASPAGTYHAVTPVRLLSTRDGIGAPKVQVPAGGTQTLQIAGNSGVPASGVTAVVLNVTVTDTTTPGHLTVYPSGSALPTTSNLNWAAGDTIPNLVTVPVGADGKVKMNNGTWAPIDLIADLQGYYTADTTGATYVPSGPTRVLDTRNGTGTGGKIGQLPAYTGQTLNITGLQGAPAGVSAVVLNVTVTNPADAGHLTVYPTGSTLPNVSNLNWSKNETIANQVIVPVGPDGSIQLYNGSWAPTDAIADVFGYLVNGTSGASFHSTTPHRLMDSRYGIGTSASQFGANETRVLGLDNGGRLSHAKAVVLNVTVTDTTTPGHITVFPTGQTMPNTSNVNFAPNQTIPNMVTVPVGADGTVSINNGTWAGDNLIVDVLGYYS